MATRFTKDDIELINSALALFEAEHEGEEPDPTRTGDEEYPGYAEDHASWSTTLGQIRAVREKVHARRRPQ